MASLLGLCYRHGSQESNLKEVFCQNAARIQPTNQSSVPEPSRPHRYLWNNRECGKLVFCVPSIKRGLKSIRLVSCQHISEPERIFSLYSDLSFQSSFLLFLLLWESLLQQSAGKRRKEEKCFKPSL